MNKMYLTNTFIRDYPFAQVLLTPVFERKRTSAPDSMRFFFVHSFLWSGVRGIKNLRGITPPDLRQVRSARPPAYCSGQLPSKERETMSALTIISTEIRQLDGLYSLNDLHKAAGSEGKYKPANFIRLDTTQALIEEIQVSEMSLANKTIHGGNNRGTYVCKELVYAYAMWISPKFHLQVIRAFDKLHQQPALPALSAQGKIYNYPSRLLAQPYFHRFERQGVAQYSDADKRGAIHFAT